MADRDPEGHARGREHPAAGSRDVVRLLGRVDLRLRLLAEPSSRRRRGRPTGFRGPPASGARFRRSSRPGLGEPLPRPRAGHRRARPSARPAPAEPGRGVQEGPSPAGRRSGHPADQPPPPPQRPPERPLRASRSAASRQPRSGSSTCRRVYPQYSLCSTTSTTRARGVPPRADAACGDRQSASSPELEGLGLVARVELEVHGNEVRIVNRTVDLVPPHATRLAADGVAVERRLPGLEVADGMLDLQNRHW